VADVLGGSASEKVAWQRYLWRNRLRFTLGSVVGQLWRSLVRTPFLDAVALAYQSPVLGALVTRSLGAALAGAPVAPGRGGAGGGTIGSRRSSPR
jgi:hypothetical protein